MSEWYLLAVFVAGSPGSMVPACCYLRRLGFCCAIVRRKFKRRFDVESVEVTRCLLREVFPDDTKFRTLEYLLWLYLKSPAGEVIDANIDDSIGRLGHYAVVPQKWRVCGTETSVALSLNTAVSERARGQGLFTRLAEETYEVAVGRGVQFVVGVANANSTPGFAGKLRFRVLGPLEVRVFLGWSFHRVNEVSIDQLDEFAGLLETTDSAKRLSLTQRKWTVKELRWRLANPEANYKVATVDGSLVVSTMSTVAGLRVSVILKVFPRPGKELVQLGGIARSIARSDRSIGSIYAGSNSGISMRGVKLPMRFRPSPLNFIVRDLTGADRELRPDVFEFLDFDAY